MKNSATFGGRIVCLILFTVLTCFLSLHSFSQQTLTTINGWNAYVHLPDDYATTGSQRYPLIVFFPGTGEVGTTASRVILYGPGYFIANGWNGKVTIGAVTYKPIIISLQPPTLYPRPNTTDAQLTAIKSLYRVDTNRISLTGLSHGGWMAEMYAQAYPTKVANVVAIQAVKPDDNPAYPAPFATFARDCGHWLGYEQINDNRDMITIYNTMTAAVPGSAQYFQTNVGGGGHCCWNTWYDPAHTDNYVLNGVSGNWSIYQYMMAYSGCTSDQPPIASAGRDTVVLVLDSIRLNGSGSRDVDGSISSYSWRKISGPAPLVMTNSNTATPTISGMDVGQYIFQLTVTDNQGMASSAQVTITSISGILPDDILNLTGQYEGGKTYLNWTANHQVDNGNFVLEKSLDGKNFSPIASIPQQFTGSATQNYSYTDNETGSGPVYYRVEYALNDRALRFSKVLAIQTGKENTFLQYYPNPAYDFVKLQLRSSNKGTAMIRLVSIDGRLLFQQQDYKNDELYLKEISLKNLPAGMYLLSLQIGNEQNQWTKIIKK